MDPTACAPHYSATDLVLIIGSIGGVLTGITTIVMQKIGNSRTAAASAISADNNVKLNAVVSQTRELARADPVASTAPTDALVQAVRPVVDVARDGGA